MDIKICLEKSSYINHRNELMENLEIPRLSEANETLGEPLAEIVFNECDSALKVAFGLEPPLIGAQGDLWVSPSNLLIGKIALTPPHTRKHIQALTHEGIINIGVEIEKKFLNEMTMEKEAALANQEKQLLHAFQDSIIAEIKDVEARERAACQREIERITQEFEIHLVEELHALETELRKEYETLAGRQEKILQEKWEEKLRVEVAKTVKKMTEEFMNELARQENVMMQHYRLEMRKKEIKRQYDIGQQHAIYTANVDQLRHTLECKNIANMMYILCMERRKCCKEKTDLEESYQAKINELNTVISEKDLELLELNKKIKEQLNNVQLRETCILEIIKQFQKFINFALRSAPTQAEFLLSVEKMLVFELTDAILNSDVRTLAPCEEFMPWVTPKSNDREEASGLEIQDFHDCFRELPPVPKEGEDQFLPAFTFKDKLYVREDFRNMLSQGIQLTPSNELWTPEVQVLMNTLEKTLRYEGTSASTVSQRSQDLPENEMQDKPHSIIQFKLAGQQQETCVEKPRRRVSLEEESSSLSRKGILECDRPSIRTGRDSVTQIDFSKIGQEETTKRLLAATSSLELILKKGSVRYIGKGDPSEIEEKLKRTTDVEPESLGHSVSDISSEQEGHRKKESYDSSTLIDDFSIRAGGSPFEYKNISDPSGISEKLAPDLVLDTRDSIVLRHMSLTKDRLTDFSASPRDSIEVAKDSIEAMKSSTSSLKKKTSRLVMARDSVELLRESKMMLQDQPCVRRDPAKSRSLVSWGSAKEPCCDKCVKMKENMDALEKVVQRKAQEGSVQESRSNVKIAQVEVINIDKEQNKSNVSFHPMPIVYETESDQVEQLSKIYQKPRVVPKKKKKPVKDKFVTLSKTVKVVGETEAKEYLQNDDEFTVDRIHSFVSMMSKHPNLIKTFTACTR